MKKVVECITGYDEVDPGMTDILDEETFMSVLNALKIDTEISKTIIRTYRSLAPERQYNKHLLTDLPKASDGRNDLSVLEGSGFYLKNDKYFTYHKGGGSVEAVAIHKLLGRSAIYPAYGAELPGKYGAFTTLSLLGVKRMWQSLVEFTTLLLITSDLIKKHNLSMPDEVLEKCIFPVAIVTLPHLKATIQQNLASKPQSIINRYEDINSMLQPAKIVMVVPSSARGTDNYEVFGKWGETDTVLLRSMAVSPNPVLHNYAANPYWGNHNSFCRGYTIKALYHIGAFYQIASCHLQNFYSLPDDAGKNPRFVGADCADLIPFGSFSEEENKILFFNLLCGWKRAESIGPSLSPTSETDYRQFISSLRHFLKGLLDDPDVEKFVSLYLILPQYVLLAIAKNLTSKSSYPAYLNHIRNSIETMGFEPEEFDRLYSPIIETHRKYCDEEYGAIIKLRNSDLSNIVYEYLYHKESTLEISALHQISEDILTLSTDDPGKASLFKLNGILIETLFHIKEKNTLRNYKQHMPHTEPDRIKEAFREVRTKYYHQISKEPENFKKHLVRCLDELIYSTSAQVKKWLKNRLEAGETNKIKVFIELLENNLSQLLLNAHEYLNDYMLYMFKRRDIACKITNGGLEDHPTPDSIDPLQEEIILRRYPKTELSNRFIQKIDRLQDISREVENVVLLETYLLFGICYTAF